MDRYPANSVVRHRWALVGSIALMLMFVAGSGAWSMSFLGNILGLAGDYAVFGLSPAPGQGTYLNFSLVTVNGDVAEGPYGTGHIFAPSIVNGTYYYDLTAQFPLLDGTNQVSGGIVQTNLAQANADALAGYAYASGLTPTQTFGNITGTTTITGNGGLNVIQIGNINMGGGTLTLTGGPNDTFILDVTGTITMGGSAEIVEGGGVLPWNVLINVIGPGQTLTTHVDNMINATILAPYRDVTFHSVNGAVLAGGGNITLMSGATVNFVPEPSTILAVFSIIGGVGGALMRRMRCAA